MNILKITIGYAFDNDFSEFLFKTERPKEDFYDCNMKLTKWFEEWLDDNHPWLLSQINDGKMDEIFWYHSDSIEVIN